MKDYNIPNSNMSTNANGTVADDLHRIHCYANTLAKLCAAGGDITIGQDQLEQIFADIANVTDKGASALYSAHDNIRAINHFAQTNNIALDTEPTADDTLCAHTQHIHLAETVPMKNTAKAIITDDFIEPPFIKTRKVAGKVERIYVPFFVKTKNRDPLDVLDEGIVLPDKYHHYQSNDFELVKRAKDSFKEKYLLVPLIEKKLPNENDHDFATRLGIPHYLECVQD